MPNFSWSQALTANQRGFDPLSAWQFRYAPYRAAVQIWDRATTAGVQITLNSGTTTVQQRSPCQGGGTAGTQPCSFNTQPIEYIAGSGDLITLSHDEVLGGTPTVDGLIIINPI